MEPEIKAFLEQMVEQMGVGDPYEGLDPEDFYCGNEDDAREMGEKHVRYRVGEKAKELLAQFESSKPEEVPERWKRQLQELIRPDGTLDWQEGAGMWLLKLPDQTLLSLSNPKRPMLRRGGRVIDGSGWCKTLEDVQEFVLRLFEKEFDFVPET